ncbi:MAG: PDZ domain-containing protein, partial [Clostridiales bacterium]|nr:PDZ domain-containing protein [Clostridiales bacterium]
MPLNKRWNIEYKRFDFNEVKTIDPPEVPYLGVEIDEKYKGIGIKIKSVKPNSAAVEAGLMPGDVITTFNVRPLASNTKENVEFFENSVYCSPFDKKIKLEIQRGGYLLRHTLEFKCIYDDKANAIFEAKSYETENDSIPSLVATKKTSVNDIDKTFPQDLIAFDKLYVSRQSEKYVSAAQWISVASIFDKYKSHDIIPEQKEIASLLLRLRLVQAECYLFAAIEQYKQAKDKTKPSDEFLNYYHKGIEQLESVVYLVNDEIDILPRYSLMFEENHWKVGEYVLDKRAGTETVGVGMVISAWDKEVPLPYKRVATYDIVPCKSIAEFTEYVKATVKTMHTSEREKIKRNIQSISGPYSRFEQVKTSVKARELLSEFCPWGVSLYYFLKDDAKVMAGFDYSILRPFGTAKTDMTLMERLLHAGGAWNVKMLSDSSLKLKVPENIQAAMQPIIGKSSPSKNSKAEIKWLKDSVGTIHYANGAQNIKWKVVQSRPTYNAWFVSPVCYNMTSSEKFSYSLKTLKILNGGIFDLAVDETIGKFLEVVEKYYGSNSPVYGASSVAVGGNNLGIDSDVVIDNKFNVGKPIKELAKAMFQYYEENEREMLYEGINPKLVKVGSSYNGEQIPPVIIRSDIFGYEDMGPYKYARTRRFLYFFVLNPSELAGKEYDLASNNIETLPFRNKYLEGDIGSHKKVWPAIPNTTDKPVGAREYITDFVPKSQIVKIKFDETEIRSWTKSGKEDIFVEVYSPENLKTPIAKKQLKTTNFIIQLNNNDYIKSNTASLRISNDWYFPENIGKEYFATELFTEYIFRVVGKDVGKDNILKETTVNFLDRPEKQVSGLISCPSLGHLAMEIDLSNNPMLEDYKTCSISIAIPVTYGRVNGKSLKGFHTQNWSAKGYFQANTFKCTEYKTYGNIYKGSLSVTVNPITMEISDFSAEQQNRDHPTFNDIFRISGSGPIKLELCESYGTKTLTATAKDDAVCQFIGSLYYNRDSGSEFIESFECCEYEGAEEMRLPHLSISFSNDI